MWVDVTVKPHQVGTVTANFVSGELDRTWTGKNTVEYDNGKTLTFAASGTLKQTAHSEGWFHVEYTDWDEAIAAIRNGAPAINDQGETMGKGATAQLVQFMQEPA